MKKIIIGSRGSLLAQQQANIVAKSIRLNNPNINVCIKTIRTSGDVLSQNDLAQSSESIKGLFVKEIEDALLKQEIDLSVHSLKDLPGELPKGLCLAAIPERQDPRDVLVTNSSKISFLNLPTGARLGTSSPRRTVQLKLLREDLIICPIRGNIDTRIEKIEPQKLDGILLAAAGLKRLNLEEKISYSFPTHKIIPAVGQGALGIEIRSDDELTRQIVEPLNHKTTQLCTLAERQFLKRIGGDCKLPMGAHAYTQNNKGFFSAFIASSDPLKAIHKTSQGNPQNLENLALETAEYLLSHGGEKILEIWNK